MASFVVHYITSEGFLDILDKDCLIDVDSRNKFRLGNLIVDSLKFDYSVSDYKKQKDKVKLITHFKDSDNSSYGYKLPNLDKFYDKYSNLIRSDYSAMGYLFHLYTDYMFFSYLYGDVISYLDSFYNEINSNSDISYVRINKNNKICVYDDFWSKDKGSIYDDYTNLNNYLINKYKVYYNYSELYEYGNKFNNPGIEEVSYSDIFSVLDKMDKFIRDGYGRLGNLNIFDKECIDKFISMVCNLFYSKYRDDIMVLTSSNKKKLVR